MKNFLALLEERRYWGKSAVGLIIKAEDTGNILVLRRSSRVNEPGTYSITISGKIDGGENAMQALLREVEEELKYSGKIDNPKLFYEFKDNDFTFNTYITKVPEEFIPKLNWEHISCFWWNMKKKIKGELHFGTKELLRKKKTELINF